MEYQIITTSSAYTLNKEITKLIEEGWKPVGSHQVVVVHQQNRFRGDQHVDTLNETEYSQTVVKEK